MVKKVLGAALYIILALVTAGALAEITLRLQSRFSDDPKNAYSKQYYRDIDAQLHTLWTGEASAENPFLPPLTVYTNRSYNSPGRLQKIFDETGLPPSQSWTSYDFIRLHTDATTTAYTVTSNSLGFRGKEYPVVKPPHTYRIIALGSYQTFGLGVSDDDTYPAKLEALLNARNDGMHYEVWNGGRAAGTAVVGLSQLQYDIDHYQPDLFIFSYGHVDDKIFGDNFFPLTALLPGNYADSLVHRYAGPVVALLDHSYLWSNWLMARYVHDPKLAADFKNITNEMTNLAWKHGIPSILVKQLPSDTLTVQEYQTLTNDHVTFFDVKSWFAKHPPEYPPSSEWKTGYWASTYLEELDPALVSSSTPAFLYYPYRLDIFQLNTLGLSEVAAGLADTIETDVLKKTP